MRGFIRAVVTRGLLLQWSVLYASDTNGHAVVAMLAEERLTPQARAAVSERLHGQPLVEVASWADYVRHQQIAPWHYVNIEIDESQYEPACHCPNRHCVIGQIERLHATLAAGAIDPAKREKSLKYLVHFVGDLHQPLHAGQHHDRGGNDVNVEVLSQTVNPSTQKPWTLHQVWDHGVLDHYAADTKQAVAQINQYLIAQNETELANGSVIEWAM